jgi:hypothetical protein
MSPFRYRDEESLSHSLLFVCAGAVAGFAAGVLVAHRFGEVRTLAAKVRDRFGSPGATPQLTDSEAYDADEFDELGISADAGVAAADTVSARAEALERRVLEAYQNDPILCERPVDIGAISEGIVELTGWVNNEEEAAHAVTIARGVPGIDTVVNRLAVRPEEDRFDEYAERYASGDPQLTERHWEGQQVGTGRRRQGNSSEPDRHADPRPALEERWTREDAAIAEAADDVGESGQRPTTKPRRSARGGRNDGSPIAPTGVPKADHVAEPPEAPPRAD